MNRQQALTALRTPASLQEPPDAIERVRRVREATGVGLYAALTTLRACGWDEEKAIDILEDE